MPPAQRLAAAGLLQRLWRGYEAQLAQRPVAVQMTTSAVLWAAGDALAQQLEGRSTVTLDARRLALTSLYGGAFVGPTGHYWYQGLDDLCTKWMRPGSVPFLATKVLLVSAPGPTALAPRPSRAVRQE